MAENVPTTEPILVLGATGRQGGAVARHLKSHGFNVRGLTRDPAKPAARDLAERDIDMVAGDLNDRASLERAMQGAFGVFSVQDFWQAGYEGEIEQGRRVADIARATGVQHFIYSSVASADQHTGLRHFDTKWIIEQHLHELGLPSTVLRPVFFMENWGKYLADSIRAGLLPFPLDPTRRLQQVAVDDIGVAAATAFANPGQWLGRVVELAGDEPTMLEAVQAFGNTLGCHVEYAQLPWADFEQTSGEELTRMYRWFSDTGYKVDIAALRVEFPQLKTLEQFLPEQDWVRAGPKATAIAS